MTKHEALLKYYGYSSFRAAQETLIDAQLSGRDVLGIMPTGAGKSVCFQIPALILDGVTLVISPLISLMKDQVSQLRRGDVPAAFINSSLTSQQYREVLERTSKGQYKIIYVAPERLETKEFVAFALNAQISLIAVDEAHCISQWGQDFRPSYLRIGDFVKKLKKRPVVGAFTATATADVKSDIVRLLDLRDPLSLTTGFDRPNLYFGVEKSENKHKYFHEMISRRSEVCGIVYCSTRKAVDSVTVQLNSRGISAARYHAGLEDAERRLNQEDFIQNRVSVMVATNAFGMGIDKPDVRYVIHYNMPKNLESYYQEAGRAGRDGKPSECILLFSSEDIKVAERLASSCGNNDELTESQQRKVQYSNTVRLDKMIRYCEVESCLRSYILKYFGEKQKGGCGNCSSCNCPNLWTLIKSRFGMRPNL